MGAQLLSCVVSSNQARGKCIVNAMDNLHITKAHKIKCNSSNLDKLSELFITCHGLTLHCHSYSDYEHYEKPTVWCSIDSLVQLMIYLLDKKKPVMAKPELHILIVNITAQDKSKIFSSLVANLSGTLTLAEGQSLLKVGGPAGHLTYLSQTVPMGVIFKIIRCEWEKRDN